jgi:hypothetical protein
MRYIYNIYLWSKTAHLSSLVRDTIYAVDIQGSSVCEYMQRHIVTRFVPGVCNNEKFST